MSDQKTASLDKITLGEILTPEQYRVTQESGTEPPFVNKYVHHFSPGLYVDIVTGEPLFASTHKFDSGSGWPSFSEPVSPDAVTYHRDISLGTVRTEVRSKSSGSHLGHVFDDGPLELGGKRYCINSAALQFIEVPDLQNSNYKHHVEMFLM